MKRVLALLAAAATASAFAAAPLRLSLAEAMQRSGVVGTDVRVTSAAENIARSDRERAIATLLPQVSANAYQSRQTRNMQAQGFSFPFPGFDPLIGPFNTFDARFELSQSVFNASSFLIARGASLGLDVAAAQRADAQEQAAVRAVMGYIGAVRNQQVVAAAESDLSLAQELLKLAQDQRGAGVASGIDVARAETQVSQDRFNLAQARATAATSIIELKRIIGVPQETELTLTDGLDFNPQPLPDAAATRAAAQEHRPELAALQAQLRQSGIEIDAEKAKRLPTLGLYGDYGYSGNTPDENNERTYTVGLRASMPIFSGGVVSAGVSAAHSRRDQVQARLDDAQAEVDQDVLIALAQLDSAGEQVRAAQATHALAQREVDLARDRFAQGVTSNVEVIEAQAALTRARTGDVGALAAYQLARANLAAAQGAARTFSLPAATAAEPQP